MTDFASTEWIDNLWGTLRRDDAARREGAAWTFGPLVIVIDADAEKGFPAPVALQLDLHEGEARDLRAVDPAQAAHSPFVLGGGYLRWKQIFAEGGDVIDTVLQGRIRCKGDLPTLMRHRRLLAAIVAAAGRTATTYPDEVAAAATV